MLTSTFSTRNFRYNGKQRYSLFLTQNVLIQLNFIELLKVALINVIDVSEKLDTASGEW